MPLPQVDLDQLVAGRGLPDGRERRAFGFEDFPRLIEAARFDCQANLKRNQRIAIGSIF